MKLYTRTGDDGMTGLFGGGRVRKDSPRMDAIGTVDELNCAIGLAAAGCAFMELTDVLRQVQNDLFDVGADLATPRREGDDAGSVRRIGPDDAARLEAHIDAACEPVEPLRRFILPGGTELAARLHLARAVCRRTERVCVTLAEQEPIGGGVIIYLNRLSDLLFAQARLANHAAGAVDVPWEQDDSPVY